MTKRLEMYRCEICGNLVQVILEGEGELVCCGKPMILLNAKDEDAEGLEKHIPVFRKTEDGKLEIRVGSVPHPMSKEHYIMFIETISDDKSQVYLRYLQPEMEAKILAENITWNVTAREYCNIHGLWEGKSDK